MLAVIFVTIIIISIRNKNLGYMEQILGVFNVYSY